MYHLVSPNILNESSLEYFINQIPDLDNTVEKDILLDLSLTESIDPYGLLVILELGIYLKRRHFNTFLNLPKNKELLRFIYGADFLKYAHLGFDEASGEATEPCEDDNFLVKISLVEKPLDIHDIVTEIRKNVRYDEYLESRDIWDNLIIMVSEICQNIPEHSQDKGFVLITKSQDKQRKRNTVRIAVTDLGIGIKGSLDRRFFPIFRDKWSDHLAIYKTLFEGISRYNDPGRGNGIIRTRELVDKYHGKMSLRSGTAKLWGNIPSWELERFFRKPLTYLGGTQISISLPINTQ